MKYLAAVLFALLAIAGIYGKALLWGVDHTAIGPPSVSANGLYVSRFYTLPETSEVPYGLGVFVRLRFIPAWISSDIVFAAYCANDQHIDWKEPKEIVVSCDVQEGKPHFFPAPHGIKVTHAGSS